MGGIIDNFRIFICRIVCGCCIIFIVSLVLYHGFSNFDGFGCDSLIITFSSFFGVLGLCCFCFGLFAFFSVTFGLCIVKSFPSFAYAVVTSLSIILLFCLQYHWVILWPIHYVLSPGSLLPSWNIFSQFSSYIIVAMVFHSDIFHSIGIICW